MPAKLHRCVKHVKRKSGKKVNAWAVCKASINKKKKKQKGK